MEKRYFTVEEGANLLGKKIEFKRTKYMEFQNIKYPVVETGTFGEVYNVTNSSEGIIVGIILDDDDVSLEEFRKDEFFHYCNLVHRCPGESIVSGI